MTKKQDDKAADDLDTYYVRNVHRETNEEGMFRRLQAELSIMAQQYGVSDEEINDMFVEVSCSKTRLLEVLKGENFTKWSELEDIAL